VGGFSVVTKQREILTQRIKDRETDDIERDEADLLAMDSGGYMRSSLGRRSRELKLWKLPKAHTKPPRPSACSGEPQASNSLPLAAMAGQEDMNRLRSSSTPIPALEQRGEGHSPRHQPPSPYAFTAGWRKL
jgi:hypothetical protein